MQAWNFGRLVGMWPLGEEWMAERWLPAPLLSRPPLLVEAALKLGAPRIATTPPRVSGPPKRLLEPGLAAVDVEQPAPLARSSPMQYSASAPVFVPCRAPNPAGRVKRSPKSSPRSPAARLCAAAVA